MQENFVTKGGLTVANTLLVVNTTGNTISITGPTTISNTVVIGTSTSNTVITSSSITIANSTANIFVSIPTITQITNGNYYLNANGSFTLVISVPAGSNTQVAYNNSGSWGGSAAFSFNNSSNTLSVSNNIIIGAGSINGLNYTGTANNSAFLGGTAASAYQLNSTLSANVATLTANNSAFLGTLAASAYQTTAGLSANVATLGYQTTAGLSANVATLTSNNSAFLGTIAASAYQTTAGLVANVATLTSNNSTNFAGQNQAYYANASSPLFSGSVSVAGGASITNGLSANNVTVTSGITSGMGTWGQAVYTFNNGISNYGVIHRNDASLYQILLTANGSPTGTWTTFRPFGINCYTGAVSIDGTGVGTVFGGAITANSATITYNLGANTITANSATIGTVTGNITGTANNITQYTINQNLGTGNTPTFNGVTITGDITAYRPASPTTGYLYLSNSGSKYLYYDGSKFNLSGGGLSTPTLSVIGNTSLYGTSTIRPLTYGGNEFSFASSSNTQFINLSDVNGSNGQNYSLTIRGLATSGSATANLASISLIANTTVISGNLQLGSGTNGAIYDTNGVLRVNLVSSGSSGYRSMGTGYGHSFADASNTVRWLMGGSSSDVNFYSQGDIVAAWSDERLKENVVSIDSSDGLDRVLSYRVVDFSWNEKGRAINSKPEGLRERGLIAQEAQKVNPQIVANNETASDENGNPYLTIKENKIVFDLISAIQALQKQIEELKIRIDFLERYK